MPAMSELASSDPRRAEGADDLVAAFTVDGAPLRGRIARTSATIDAILRRHAYPAPVALLLGEALVFASLMASLLKVDGKLSIQAQGDGLVPLLVAEHVTGGALRGYARLAPNAASELAGAHRLAPRDLVGEGVLSLTLTQGDDFAPHQGLVPMQGRTLAECAEAYFRDSEQVETRIKLAVGEVMGVGHPNYWRAGGALIQRVAADDARGDPEDAWRRAAIFLDTLTDEEMLDPALPADRVLYRLFQEDGVRMADPVPLVDQCSCDEQRLEAALAHLSAHERAELAEPDGFVHATCQFCAREYLLKP